ncbi:efflux RND transporter periplasmic adaptor subunit [Pseudidiomarina insulisalsae]|uniref:Cobalt transporter n=1 Tax=Pseudidiomarina insulisalsae TaxID=575789 RepID=A0A432YQM2_9GAMM|nr:efflux RND transporter periplasmic adaptor subunit [Pseudidiomarina insulisalsae]RUO63647.1 cobalt transporter [Pseudidiomarina insulisalsae]
MKFKYYLVLVLCLLGTLNSPAFAVSEDDHEHHDEESSSTTLTPAAIADANFKIEPVGAKSLQFTQTLFGVIAPVNSYQVAISATYPGQVTDVRVNIGDKVQQGETLITIRNAASGREYSLTSPISGEVTFREANRGEFAQHQTLLKITDFSEVWVELSAFPEGIEALQKGQQARVYDLHKHEHASGQISYIAPQMTGGHIARARVQIANPQGHWRPGMHVKTDVFSDTKEVALAVARDALQTFRGDTVVFVQEGNTFTARPLELGRDDGEFVEVLSGIEADTPYVTHNSFLLKADILKAGAGHHH